MVSRSHTDTDQELSPSERSDDTRSPLSFSSESFPSSDSSEKSPRTSRLIFDSSLPPSWLFRKPPRPTSSVSLKTPTCAPSTPSVSPLCPRTSSLPAASVVSVLKLQSLRPFNTTQSAFFKAKGLDLDLNSFKTNETVANKINYFLKEVPKYWQAIEGVNLQKVLNRHKAFFTTNIIDFSTEDFKFVNAAQEDVPDPQAPEPMDTNEASSAPTKPPTPFKDYTERHQRRLAKDKRWLQKRVPRTLTSTCRGTNLLTRSHSLKENFWETSLRVSKHAKPKEQSDKTLGVSTNGILRIHVT